MERATGDRQGAIEKRSLRAASAALGHRGRAVAQTETGVFSAGPPRRSGEGRPLRAIGRHCKVRSLAKGGPWRRPAKGRQGRRLDRRYRHEHAQPVAVAAVQIERSDRLATDVGGCSICSLARGRVSMGMLVMAQVRRLNVDLMRAVAHHRRPAELKRKQGQQHDAKPATHATSVRAGPAPSCPIGACNLPAPWKNGSTIWRSKPASPTTCSISSTSRSTDNSSRSTASRSSWFSCAARCPKQDRAAPRIRVTNCRHTIER